MDEVYAKQETSIKQAGSKTWCSQLSTWWHIPEGRTLHKTSCENHKSYLMPFIFANILV
jgi:hypothetical protein